MGTMPEVPGGGRCAFLKKSPVVGQNYNKSSRGLEYAKKRIIEVAVKELVRFLGEWHVSQIGITKQIE